MIIFFYEIINNFQKNSELFGFLHIFIRYLTHLIILKCYIFFLTILNLNSINILL